MPPKSCEFTGYFSELTAIETLHFSTQKLVAYPKWKGQENGIARTFLPDMVYSVALHTNILKCGQEQSYNTHISSFSPSPYPAFCCLQYVSGRIENCNLLFAMWSNSEATLWR